MKAVKMKAWAVVSKRNGAILWREIHPTRQDARQSAKTFGPESLWRIAKVKIVETE